MRQLLFLLLFCSFSYAANSELSREQWKEKNRAGCKYKVPGKFKVVDKASAFAGCTGTVMSYPMLDRIGVWQYTFRRMDTCPPATGFFSETQVDRLGNLND